MRLSGGGARAAGGQPEHPEQVAPVQRRIDAIIRQARATGNPLYIIDGDLLRRLQPDLILTQELCEVCAVGAGSVFETAAKALDYSPEILSIRPAGLDDIFGNIQRIGDAAGVPERAASLLAQLRARTDYVAERAADGHHPKVFCIDWLEPLRNTGQWSPELVELAGGEEGLAEKGASRGSGMGRSDRLPAGLRDGDALRL